MKYHINPETMRPNICRAKKPESCPYFDAETQTPAPHFDSKPEARVYVEEMMKKEIGETVALKKSSGDSGPGETIFIPSYALAHFEELIDERNRRLKKLGSEEFFSFTATPVGLQSEDIFDYKKNRTQISLNHPVLKVGDHSVIGRIEKEEGGLIYKQFEDGVKFRADDLKCDHCGKKRHRKTTYIIRDEESGEVSQIGSSCVEPFAGISPPLLTATELNDDFGEYDDLPFKSRSLPVKPVLNLALAMTDEGEDYISRSKEYEYGADSTATTLLNYLRGGELPKTSLVRERSERLRESKKVDELIKDIEELSGDSEWEENLKTLVRGEYVSEKNIPLLVSSVVVARRKREESKKVKFKPGFAGKVKERLKPQRLKVVSKLTRSQPGYGYGSGMVKRDIITFRNSDGQMLTFFGSREYKMSEGDEVELKGATVKSLGQFKGVDQTVISRPLFEGGL